jgi:hypothetical protein
MVLAATCLCSLRPTPEGKWLRVYGASFLVCSGLLLCIRDYEPSARLVGYGLIILIMGFRPLKWANGVWMLYGLVSLVTAVENGITSNSLAINDPRYAELAAEVRSYYLGSEIIATNSFHILDVHAGIPSIPVEDYPDILVHASIPSISVDDYPGAASYHKFFWVTSPVLPGAVTPMPHPGKEWCEEKRFSGGVLFTRCAAATGPSG